MDTPEVTGSYLNYPVSLQFVSHIIWGNCGVSYCLCLLTNCMLSWPRLLLRPSFPSPATSTNPTTATWIPSKLCKALLSRATQYVNRLATPRRIRNTTYLVKRASFPLDDSGLHYPSVVFLNPRDSFANSVPYQYVFMHLTDCAP